MPLVLSTYTAVFTTSNIVAEEPPNIPHQRLHINTEGRAPARNIATMSTYGNNKTRTCGPGSSNTAAKQDKFVCRVGNEVRAMDHFSNIEIKKYKAAKAKGYTYKMRCREHTQGAVTEIRCVDCGVMKPVDGFSNSNRKATGNQRCRMCVEFTESDLAQTTPLPAPDGLRSVDEWDLSSRIKQSGDLARTMENLTMDQNDTRSMTSLSHTSRNLRYLESSVTTDRASTVVGPKSGIAQPLSSNAYGSDGRVQPRSQGVRAQSDRCIATSSAASNKDTATNRGGWAKVPSRKNELKVPSYLSNATPDVVVPGEAGQDESFRHPRTYDSDESLDQC